MANYVITTHVIGPQAPRTVAASLEIYLETLDSSTQTVIDISYCPQGNLTTCIVTHNDTS